jgi:hypothetical protein
MTMISLSLPEETFLKYQEHDKQNPRLACVQQLTRYADHSPKDRVLVLTKEQRLNAERMYGQPIEDMGAFLKWVEGLCHMRIGEESIPLSTGQLKTLSLQAAFHKREIGPFIAERVKFLLGRELGQ